MLPFLLISQQQMVLFFDSKRWYYFYTFFEYGIAKSASDIDILFLCLAEYNLTMHTIDSFW